VVGVCARLALVGECDPVMHQAISPSINWYDVSDCKFLRISNDKPLRSINHRCCVSMDQLAVVGEEEGGVQPRFAYAPPPSLQD